MTSRVMVCQDNARRSAIQAQRIGVRLLTTLSGSLGRRAKDFSHALAQRPRRLKQTWLGKPRKSLRRSIQGAREKSSFEAQQERKPSRTPETAGKRCMNVQEFR